MICSSVAVSILPFKNIWGSNITQARCTINNQSWNDILCEEHFLKKESFLHITLSSSREKWMMKVNSWTYGGPGFYRDSASKKADNWLRSHTGVIPKSAAKEPKPQKNCSKQHLPSICSWRSSSWSVGWLTHGCSCKALYPRRSWHTDTLSVNTSYYTSISILILCLFVSLCMTYDVCVFLTRGVWVPVRRWNAWLDLFPSDCQWNPWLGEKNIKKTINVNNFWQRNLWHEEHW